MRYIDGDINTLPVVELTRRNLETLLEKLDDPLSNRMLIDPDWMIRVHAEEQHIPDEEPKINIRAVEDSEHYSDRAPGVVYMPTKDEYQ